MMKTTKKFLSMLLIMIFALSVFTISASAASTESESNDSYSTANTLSPNGTISGTMKSSSDVDYYKITATSNGKISIKFKHTYVNKSWGWLVKVFIYSNGSYNEISSSYVDLAGNESVSLPNVGAVASGVYYIKISDNGNSTNEKYSIETSFTSTDYYEKEINNVYSSATVLKLNNTYNGSINKSDDLDYYKMTVPSNGKISLKFKHTYTDLSWGWVVKIYCYFDGTYTELSSYYIDLRGDESIKLPSIGAVPSGTYYIRVSDNGNSVGQNYSIEASFTSTDYFEKELNNVYTTATQIKTGNTYSGVINKSDDADYYKLTATSSGKISIKFNHSYVNASWGWQVRVYSYSDGKYTELYSTYVDLRGAESLSLTDINAVSSGVYFIKVTDNGNSVGEEYSLAIIGSSSVTKYTVTFNANGGSVSPSSSTVESGKSVILPTPSKSGYTCLGWSTSSSASSASYACGASYTPTKNITLYAVWKANPTTTKYTVTYNANGGSISPSSATVESGKSVALPTPSKSGYTCLGWSTSSSASSATYSCGASYTPTKSITLYAVWKKNTSSGRVVSVSIDDFSLRYKETSHIEPKIITEGNVNYTIKYTVSKEDVVRVYSDGKVVGLNSLARKTATITCTVTDEYGNHATDRCIVSVGYNWWQWIIGIVLFGWLWY